MINFNHTAEINGQIEFVNEKGETVSTYHLTELEDFVICKGLNTKHETVETSGSSWGGNPNYTEEEIEVTTPVSEWLDNEDNFLSATEKFYNFKNPHEFKSANSEQETIRRVG